MPPHAPGAVRLRVIHARRKRFSLLLVCKVEDDTHIRRTWIIYVPGRRGTTNACEKFTADLCTMRGRDRGGPPHGTARREVRLQEVEVVEDRHEDRQPLFRTVVEPRVVLEERGDEGVDVDVVVSACSTFVSFLFDPIYMRMWSPVQSNCAKLTRFRFTESAMRAGRPSASMVTATSSLREGSAASPCFCSRQLRRLDPFLLECLRVLKL